MAVFWVVPPCALVGAVQRFGGGGELDAYSADIGKYEITTVKIKEFGVSFRILYLHSKLFYSLITQ
jgi:hypothetical protein